MQTTVNYGLKKPEGTDVVNVNDFNANADIIDGKLKEYSNQFADLIYPTAGGTATAITLTLPTLTNGYAKTFIALANNGGSATTINGVPLYKPGTTTAPNLIAGKAYTVWYNSATPCFFIKASAEGSAVASNVLAGTTFSNDSDTGLPGAMVNNGAVTITPGATAKTIPQGYHNGSGTVATDSNLLTGNIRSGITIFGVAGKLSVVETSDGTATAGQMLSGATGYVNGTKITGTIASKGATTYTPGTTAQTIASGQYISGVQTISGDSNLVTGNIRSGVSIFGISGKSSVVDTADGSAIASQILSGYTAYVNGSKITGSMNNITTDQNATATATSGTTIGLRVPQGYYDGTRNVNGNSQSIDGNLQPGNILNGLTIMGVTGNLINKRTATGSTSAIADNSATYHWWADVTGYNRHYPYIEVTGLSFNPSIVIACYRNSTYQYTTIYESTGYSYVQKTIKYLVQSLTSYTNGTYYEFNGDTYTKVGTSGTIPCVNYGFCLPIPGAGAVYQWFAIE